MFSGKSQYFLLRPVEEAAFEATSFEVGFLLQKYIDIVRLDLTWEFNLIFSPNLRILCIAAVILDFL